MLRCLNRLTRWDAFANASVPVDKLADGVQKMLSAKLSVSPCWEFESARKVSRRSFDRLSDVFLG